MEPSHAPERLHAPEADFGDTLDWLIEADFGRAIERFRQVFHTEHELNAYEAFTRLEKIIERDPYRAAEIVNLALDYRFTSRTPSELGEMHDAVHDPVMEIIEGEDEPLSKYYRASLSGRELYPTQSVWDERETAPGETLDRLLESDSDRDIAKAIETYTEILAGENEDAAYEAILRLPKFVERRPYESAELINQAGEFRFTHRTFEELEQMRKAMSEPAMRVIESNIPLTNQQELVNLSQHYRNSLRVNLQPWQSILDEIEYARSHSSN